MRDYLPVTELLTQTWLDQRHRSPRERQSAGARPGAGDTLNTLLPSLRGSMCRLCRIIHRFLLLRGNCVFTTPAKDFLRNSQGGDSLNQKRPKNFKKNNIYPNLPVGGHLYICRLKTISQDALVPYVQDVLVPYDVYAKADPPGRVNRDRRLYYNGASPGQTTLHYSKQILRNRR